MGDRAEAAGGLGGESFEGWRLANPTGQSRLLNNTTRWLRARRWRWRGVAWRVAWRGGVAWRGVAWRAQHPLIPFGPSGNPLWQAA